VVLEHHHLWLTGEAMFDKEVQTVKDKPLFYRMKKITQLNNKRPGRLFGWQSIA